MDPQGQATDGGWAWYLVIGVAIINVFNQSILSLFGLLFGPRLTTLVGASGMTTVMSINVTLTNLSGFLLNPLLKRLKTKRITQIGIVLVSLGLAISGLMDSFVSIIFGYGVLTGVGLGLISSSTFLLINTYFNKRKSQAVGLTMAGTSVGQMALPTLVGIFLKKTSFNTTIYVLSGLSLTGLFATLLFRFTEMYCRSDIVLTLHREISEDKVTTIDGSLTNSNEEKEKPKSEPFYEKMIRLFDLQLLLDPIFLHILIGLSLAYVSSISFGAFFPLYLKEEQNMEIMDVSSCMSLLSGMDLFGRLTIPILSSTYKLKHRTTFIIALVALIIARTLLILQTRYIMVVLISAVCGFARAATVINQNLVVAEYCKKEQVGSAITLNMVSKGLFIFIVSIILGKVKDYTKSYATCILIINCIVVVVVVSWCIEIIIRRIWKKRSKK